MAIHTQDSLTGFIASDPQLNFTTRGDARFYARIGQEHYRRNSDGTFTQVEPTFHDLVLYRASAERAYVRFAKGDNFVAEGYIHTFEYERDGQSIQGEEFVAKKIGHDVARTSYEVDRTPHATPAPVQETEASAHARVRKPPAPIPDPPRPQRASQSPSLGR